jgi:hypothetical protein
MSLESTIAVMRVLSILVRHMEPDEVEAASEELQQAADSETDVTERQFLREAAEGLHKLAADLRTRTGRGVKRARG